MLTSLSSPERGASAVFVAATLLVLMGFAALAVDTGSAFNERRQQQSAVDAAVLSAGLGAQFSPTQTGCGSGNNVQQASCNGAVVAIDIVNTNLGTTYTAADFANSSLCPDDEFPAEFVGSGGFKATIGGTALDCLRWTRNLGKIHMILPIEEVDTTFGRVLGRLTIDVNALAEAEASLGQVANLIPFVVGPTGAALNHGCLFEPSTGLNSPPCGNGPTEGNFGYMLPYLYGDDVLGTPVVCNPLAIPANQSTVAATFAKGSDHLYLTNDLVSPDLRDDANCPNKNIVGIDTIDVRTGGVANPAEQGAFGTILGTEGRLRCKDGDAGEPTWFDPSLTSRGNCESVNDRHPETLDDNPLWSFISTTASSQVSACAGVTDKVAMEACLAAWRTSGATDPLFTTDLGRSPRFAWIPRLNVDPGTGGSGYYTIEEFLPVYLQTVYLKCSGGNSCDVVFDPGEGMAGTACTGLDLSCGWPSNGNKSLDAMSAFILRPDMLPFPLSIYPNQPGSLVYNLSK